MDSKSDLNYKPEEFDAILNGRVDNKSPGDLESIVLENVFAEQNFSTLADSPSKSDYVPQPAVYITEIGDRFYLLDYAEELEPKPIPLEAENLSRLPNPMAEKVEPLEHSPAAKSSLFSGKKGLLWGIGLGILLTFGATRIFAPQTTVSQNTSESTKATESTVSSQTVTVAEVTTTDIDSTLNASGTVIAYERTPVMSQAAGLQITDVLVERGDYVTRGQVLARLNDRVLNAEKLEAEGAVAQAKARVDELLAGSRSEEIARAESRVANARSAVAQAESELELVQKRAERNQTLQAEGAISRDRLDEILNQERVAESDLIGAKANLNEARQELAQLRAGSRPETIAQARAELTQARGRLQVIEAQLADATITAPTAGIIASREAKVGQITSNSEMLFAIIQDGRLELRLEIPETLIGKIQPGQSALVTSNNRDLKLTGKVRQIDPAIDDSSRQATVRVDLPQSTNLKPGMFLQAAINTATNQGLAVPIAALLPQSGNRAIAFVVQPDNTVKAQKVIMGEILSEQKAEIIEGLQPGDRIVLKGAAYLQDGDRVAVSEQ